MYSQLLRLIPRYLVKIRVNYFAQSASDTEGCVGVLGSKNLKVTVCGASGGIGQPLCLMLKQSPLIDELALFDIQNTKGVGLDVSHLDTRCKVCAYNCKEDMEHALKDAKIVLLAAGSPQKSGMSMETLLKKNAKITEELAEACIQFCPKAMIAVITSPINSLVPLVYQVYKKANVQAKNRIFGVTTLDVVRANTFVAEVMQVEPECVMVPVIGGNSPRTILPILSQSTPKNKLKDSEIQMLTHAIKEASSVIAKAKAGQGSASLSAAFAAARFTIALVKGLCGHSNVVECAYVRSDCVPDVEFFSTPLELGPAGVQKNFGLPKMSEYECCLLADALPHLAREIKLADTVSKKGSRPKPVVQTSKNTPLKGAVKLEADKKEAAEGR